MNLEQDITFPCPYCGETVGAIVDCTVSNQKYVEDCQVCCRPIQITVAVDDDGEVDFSAVGEDG